MPSTSENTLCDIPVKTEKRSPSPIVGPPSTCDSPVHKRLRRRIIELSNIVKTKNVKLRKVRDCNRRLRRKIVSYKSLLAELKTKIHFST